MHSNSSTGSIPTARMIIRVRCRFVSCAAARPDATGAAFAEAPFSGIELLRSSGEGHDLLLTERRCRVAPDLPGDMSRAHHDDAVADADDLGQVGRNDENRGARLREIVDDRIDLGLGADIDTARRLVEDQDFRADREQPRQQYFLLVAAGEPAGGNTDIRSTDAEPRERAPCAVAGLVAVEDAAEFRIP